MTEGASSPFTIGWREWVDLPDWGLRMRAKIDTGARSSAIDCATIKKLSGNRVRFTIRLSRKKDETHTLVQPIAFRKRVRSSTGHGEDRLFVATTLRIGLRSKTILVSLVCRKRMIHRMLLGREALAGDFLVDSSIDHVATPRRIETFRRSKRKTAKKPKKKVAGDRDGGPRKRLGKRKLGKGNARRTATDAADHS